MKKLIAAVAIALFFSSGLFAQGGCTAGFLAFPDSASSYTVQFIDNSTGFHEYWFWEFGDGTSSTQANPIHSYNAGGSYLVCLTIWDSLGTCQDTYCDSVYVQGYPGGVDCENIFTYLADDSLTCFFEGTAYFNGNLSNNNADFIWDFGDGSTGTGQTISHTFPQNGLYYICLTTVHYDSIPDTCMAVSCQSVWVGNDTTASVNVSGTVYLQNQMPADVGEVYLMNFDSMGVNQLTIQTTFIDSSGMYTFANVPMGSYYIQAELGPNSAYFGQYMPTYHLSALYWQNANLVFPDPVSLYDIYMISDSAYAPGIGNIHGIVEEESFRELMEGVEMMLLAPDNVPFAYVRTDENGEYSFGELAYGNYTIYAEIMGVETIPVTVTLDEANPTHEVNILVKDGVAVGIDEGENKTIEEMGNIYPNPIRENAQFMISLRQQAGLEINIMNLVGQKVLHQALVLPAGRQNIQLNTGGIPSGLYHLQIISSTGESISRKLIKY